MQYKAFNIKFTTISQYQVQNFSFPLPPSTRRRRHRRRLVVERKNEESSPKIHENGRQCGSCQLLGVARKFFGSRHKSCLIN
jgi:hypothetical protein